MVASAELAMLEAYPASQCNGVDGDGQTQLHRAVEAADAATLRLLLARRSLTQGTVDATDRWGRTALHAAAARGSDAMCATLLRRRASPLVRDAEGCTPLHRAASAGHVAAVRVLVAAAPMSICEAGCTEGGLTGDGWTPVHWAAMTGQDAVLRVLLDQRVGATAASEVDGAVECHTAAPCASCRRCAIEAAFKLQTHSGWTALHLAAQGGHVECVRLLLPPQRYERDPAAALVGTTYEGNTPLHLAMRGCLPQHAAVVTYLRSLHRPIDMQGSYLEAIEPFVTAKNHAGHDALAHAAGPAKESLVRELARQFGVEYDDSKLLDLTQLESILGAMASTKREAALSALPTDLTAEPTAEPTAELTAELTPTAATTTTTKTTTTTTTTTHEREPATIVSSSIASPMAAPPCALTAVIAPSSPTSPTAQEFTAANADVGQRGVASMPKAGVHGMGTGGVPAAAGKKKKFF